MGLSTTFTTVGTAATGSTASSSVTSGPFNPTAIGDVIVVWTANSASAATVSSITHSGVAAFVKITSENVNGSLEMWYGQITATGSSTLSITWGTSGSLVYAAQQFHSSTAGGWSADTVFDGSTGTTGATGNYASATPAQPNVLYLGGYEDARGTSSNTLSGSSTGFTYLSPVQLGTSTGVSLLPVYSLSPGTGPSSPNWSSGGYPWGTVAGFLTISPYSLVTGNSNNSSSSSTTLSIAGVALSGIGDVVVVAVANASNASVSSISHPAVTTWKGYGGPLNTYEVELWYGIITTNTSGTFAVTYTTSCVNRAFSFSQFHSTKSGTWQVNTPTNTSLGSGNSTVASITPPESYPLYLGAVGAVVSGSTTGYYYRTSGYVSLISNTSPPPGTALAPSFTAGGNYSTVALSLYNASTSGFMNFMGG